MKRPHASAVLLFFGEPPPSNLSSKPHSDLYTSHWREKWEELKELYHSFAWFNYIGRMLTIKYLKLFVRQAEGLRGLSAEEKYRYMVESQPEIALRVPIKYMASHLGINDIR